MNKAYNAIPCNPAYSSFMRLYIDSIFKMFSLCYRKKLAINIFKQLGRWVIMFHGIGGSAQPAIRVQFQPGWTLLQNILGTISVPP